MKSRVSKIAIFIAASAIALRAQAPAAAGTPPDLTGVYQIVPNSVTLPGGLKNSGSPKEVPLTPAAAQQMKTINLKDDPGRLCHPLGPFRTMAEEHNKIELLPGQVTIMMLFEDISHGHLRTIAMKRAHPANVEPTWEGDSTGRWEANTLIIDTVGFNDRTWLNAQGAQHSDALHLIERIRPVLAATYLEYKVTVEDPKSLARPYSYTRYYKKLDTETAEDVCVEEEIGSGPTPAAAAK